MRPSALRFSLSFSNKTRHTFASRLLLLAFTILTTLSLSVNAAKTDQEKQLEKLRQTINALKKELASTKTNRDEINQTLEKQEKNIGELSKKARKIEGELKERQHKLKDLRDERSQLNDKKRHQEGLVGDYINAAYRLGQQGNLRLLLNQEDPSRVSRNLRYYDYFVQARAEKITQYLTTIERINSIEPEIAYETEKVRQNFESLSTQKTKLQEAQRARRKVLASLNERINSQDKKLRSKMEDRRQLQKLLAKVIENISDIHFKGSETSFSSLKGKLPWPTQGKVVKRFGSNRITNKMKWEGMLISSNPGDPVRSVHYGRVIFSDYLRGHGLLIIVDHGTGFMSLYAHNQALYKELGEWVEQGDIIASVGSSGGQHDSALYFELRYNGKPTNPQRWLRRA
ncbi:MAG: peptidoglycan DD-metalloendopeptidase family protein [Agarilytica sp.]